MRFLRTNTAVIVTVGPFYDKTDGVTIETALTITNERITLTADTDDGSAPTNILDNVTGATSGTSNDLNYITGNDAGMMQLELSAANTNRLGRMLLSITDAANHVPVFHEFMVLPAMIYDALVAGSDRLDANVTHVADTAQTAADLAGLLGALNTAASSGDPGTTTTLVAYLKQIVNTLEGSAGIPTFPSAAVAANAVSLAEVIRSIDTRLPSALGANSNIKADVRDFNGTAGTFASGRPEVNTTHLAGTAYATAAAALVAAVWDALTSSMSTVGSIGKKLADWVVGTIDTYTGNTKQTGDTYARLGAPAGASTAADIAAVKTDTGNLVTRITSTLFSGITSLAQWLGLIAGKQTGNSTARTELRATGAGSGTFDETTDSTEALRDRGDAAWTTATGFSTHSAADVWASGTRTLTSFGTLVADAAAAVWAYATRILTAATNITSTGGTTVPQTGDSYARIGAPVGASISADIASVLTAASNRPKKNTAFAGWTFFMRDSTNHQAATGLTVTAQRSLDGAALGACANAVSEIGNGLYKIDLAAGDLNGNVVTLRFTAALADDFIQLVVTQP